MILSLNIQYIPRNMHTFFALLCFVVVIHWLIFPYPSGLLHWHCGNLTIAPVPAKQPWWIWINTSCEFIMNDCITTTKQSTTKPCAYFMGYTVSHYTALFFIIGILTWIIWNFHIAMAPCLLLETLFSCKQERALKSWLHYSPCHTYMYSISQEICTLFCCALLCCGYAIVHNEFMWNIYPYSSGLLYWHWGNR